MGQRWSCIRRPAFWTGVFLSLGLALRAFHYFRDPSIWHDEAALVLNVLAKGFRELLGPLLWAEAAPPLFLWIERACILIAGDSTYVLRLLPFLASCLALVWLVVIARRVLPPPAVPWAILLIACSDRLLWHACEAKPYAVDALCGVAVVGVFCSTSSAMLGQRLLAYTLLAPLVIFVSYPGCFLMGGVLVALLPAACRERRPAIYLGYGLLVAAVFASFALLTLGPVRAQRCADMVSCWERHFPQWHQPQTIPGWMLFSTLDIVRYCCKPFGQLLSVLALIGAFALWQRGQRALLVLLTLPLGLALIAACLHAYPYGGARVEVFAAPSLALLIAAGVPPTLGWLRRTLYDRARIGCGGEFPTCPPNQGKLETCPHGYSGISHGHLGMRPASGDLRHSSGFSQWPIVARSSALLGYVSLIVCLLSPLHLALYHAVVPWERPDCAGAAAYVLAHCRPKDGISANQWAYSYYFRWVTPGVRLMGDRSLASDDNASISAADRQWFVITADNAADRTTIVQALPLDGWLVLDWHEFALTTVLLLGKK